MTGPRLQLNPGPLKIVAFHCPAGCKRMHEPHCRYYLGGWYREAIEGERVGRWYFYTSAARWELQQRSGEDDFGWYLYGPDGSPFGQFLCRRLGPAKLIAQDYAEDYPGARDWLRADQDGEVYAARAKGHGW